MLMFNIPQTVTNMTRTTRECWPQSAEFNTPKPEQKDQRVEMRISIPSKP